MSHMTAIVTYESAFADTATAQHHDLVLPHRITNVIHVYSKLRKRFKYTFA